MGPIPDAWHMGDRVRPRQRPCSRRRSEADDMGRGRGNRGVLWMRGTYFRFAVGHLDVCSSGSPNYGHQWSCHTLCLAPFLHSADKLLQEITK